MVGSEEGGAVQGAVHGGEQQRQYNPQQYSEVEGESEGFRGEEDEEMRGLLLGEEGAMDGEEGGQVVAGEVEQHIVEREDEGRARPIKRSGFRFFM
jgi:hypothetical protein